MLECMLTGGRIQICQNKLSRPTLSCAISRAVQKTMKVRLQLDGTRRQGKR